MVLHDELIILLIISEPRKWVQPVSISEIIPAGVLDDEIAQEIAQKIADGEPVV